MPLILRKCKSDGSSSYDFKYGNVGDIVVCPDWEPTTEYGNGLHGLLEGNGDWLLLKGEDWLVIKANKKDILEIDKDQCKFKKGKIVYRGSKEGLAQFISKFKLNSNAAYCWANYIGNHDLMINRIDDSNDAYRWALSIGNKEEMIKFIDNARDAFYWAKNIGNKEEMIKFIDNSKYAYFWAFYIGNKEEMIELIDNAHDALIWGKDIGDIDQMIKKFPKIELNFK